MANYNKFSKENYDDENEDDEDDLDSLGIGKWFLVGGVIFLIFIVLWFVSRLNSKGILYSTKWSEFQ